MYVPSEEGGGRGGRHFSLWTNVAAHTLQQIPKIVEFDEQPPKVPPVHLAPEASQDVGPIKDPQGPRGAHDGCLMYKFPAIGADLANCPYQGLGAQGDITQIQNNPRYLKTEMYTRYAAKPNTVSTRPF